MESPPVNAADARDITLIPGSGRSPGEGNGNLSGYSCLEYSMDRGAWWATVHGVAKSWDTAEHVCACMCTHTQMPERLWGVQGREKVKARPGDRLKRQSPDRLWAKGREKFRAQAGNRFPCCALPTSSGSRVQVNLSHPEFPWQPGDKIS